MLEEKKDKAKFARTRTLCDTCRRATPTECLFWALPNAEQGLKLVQAQAIYRQVQELKLFKVIACPGFEKGQVARWW